MKTADAKIYIGTLDPEMEVIVLPRNCFELISNLGMSPETLILRLLCGESRTAHPKDIDDFERCLGIMKVFPEIRERLGEMSEVSPEWAAWVERWSEFEDLLRRRRGGDSTAYNPSPLIKQMLDEVREMKNQGTRR